MIPYAEALSLLVEGNRLYQESVQNPAELTHEIRVAHAENGQLPFAVVIACADSRVPVEHMFSAGIGDLFVVRNAGNVITEIEAGSAEYAADHLGTQLIVLMGHTGCGAVHSTLTGHATGNIRFITDRIALAIGEERDARRAEWLNVEEGVNALRRSHVLERLTAQGRLKIVGAMYDIKTGHVSFAGE